jgi:predicted enzyme related to lactoylglutathione lyase
MKTKSFSLAWIVVKDFKKAVKFYTEKAGLKLLKASEEHGWAELQGHEEGAMLGIATVQKECPLLPGQNACVTLTVEDIDKAKDDLHKEGVKFLGEIHEIPGHVKLLMAVDPDGNHFQLVQMLDI